MKNLTLEEMRHELLTHDNYTPAELDDMDAVAIVNAWLALPSTALTPEEEVKPLRVCQHCLWAIESREGNQRSLCVYVDEEDEEESRCDWCEESGFDTLYEI